jgi:hypothetical protein
MRTETVCGGSARREISRFPFKERACVPGSSTTPGRAAARVGAAVRVAFHSITHSSVIKTTFLLYFAVAAGMMAACDEMGAVSIIGRWNPFA